MFCQGLVWSHALYLLHVLACDFYGPRCQACLRRCRIRVDFDTIHPLLLEWIHNAETALVLAFAGGPPIYFVVSAAFVLRMLASDKRTLLVSRKYRASDALAAGLCLTRSPLAFLHAGCVPSRTATRLVLDVEMRSSGALLLAMHVACAGAAHFSGVAAACGVVVARDLAHAFERRWPRPSATLRGPAAAYEATSDDLVPPSFLWRRPQEDDATNVGTSQSRT